MSRIAGLDGCDPFFSFSVSRYIRSIGLTAMDRTKAVCWQCSFTGTPQNPLYGRHSSDRIPNLLSATKETLRYIYQNPLYGRHSSDRIPNLLNATEETIRYITYQNAERESVLKTDESVVHTDAEGELHSNSERRFGSPGRTSKTASSKKSAVPSLRKQLV